MTSYTMTSLPADSSGMRDGEGAKVAKVAKATKAAEGAKVAKAAEANRPQTQITQK
jgi:hypothetical protein